MRTAAAKRPIVCVAIAILLLAASAHGEGEEFVIATGSCFYGELGLGDMSEYNCIGNQYGSYLGVTVVPSLIPSEIADIQAGAHFTVLQYANESLAAMGDNEYGQVGTNDPATATYDLPALVQVEGTPMEGHSITALSAGGSHVMVRLDNNSLVGWGLNYYGVLANGQFYQNVVPQAILSTEAQSFMPMNVSCGSLNCFGIQNGRLIAAWGDGEYCSLGIDPMCNPSLTAFPYTTPATPWGEISELTVVKIGGGSFYSLALTDDGRVWSVGFTPPLGREGNSTIFLPINQTLIGDVAESENNKVIDIVGSGQSFSLALTHDRRIFSWGHSTNGKLGNPEYTENLYLYAIPVDMTPFGAEIVQKLQIISETTYALTTSGSVFIWGPVYNLYEFHLPTRFVNTTQYIVHDFYGSCLTPSHIFMRASINPNPPDAPSAPGLLPPLFLPATSGNPDADPIAPSSDAVLLTSSFTTLLLLALAALLH